VLGLGIAYGGVGMLTALAARYSPRANEINVDGVVLSFTLALVLLSRCCSRLRRSVKEEALASGLAAGGRPRDRRREASAAAARTGRAQVAVSVVLLTGAGLLVRTISGWPMSTLELNTHNVLTMEVPHDFGVGSVERRSRSIR